MPEDLGAESLVAGIGEDFDAERVLQPVGYARLAGLGDVSGAAAATGAAVPWWATVTLLKVGARN